MSRPEFLVRVALDITGGKAQLRLVRVPRGEVHDTVYMCGRSIIRRARVGLQRPANMDGSSGML